MNKQEYMEQLKKRLKRLPGEDFERAVEYFEEYFAEAGVENEAKAIEDLGPVKEAADQIIMDMALDYSKEPVRDVKSGFHGLWVLFLALCAAPLALPLLLVGVVLVFTAIIIVATVLFALLLVAACGVLTGPLIFVAGLTVIHRSIPVFITCTGIGLLFTGAGTAMIYGMYQLCKRFLGWSMQGLAGMIQRGGKKHA